VRDDPRAASAADRGRGVAGAVVDQEHVDRQAARLARQPGEHLPHRRLLVAGHGDGETAPGRRGCRRSRRRRKQRAAARCLRRRHAEQGRDRRGELAHRARFALDGPGQRALPPDHERDRPLAPVEVAVTADPAPLAVIRHEHDRGAAEPAALLQEAEEIADAAVGFCKLVEVLGAAHTAHVTELVGRQQLQDEQVGVLFLDHAPALSTQRAVDLRRRLDRADRPNDVIAEGVEQVGDAHEPPPAPFALERIEDRLDPDPEPRSEVRAHAVLVRRGAGQHRGEADDRARGVGGLHGEVLGALTGEPVHHGCVRLPQPAAVAAVDDDDVDPAGEGVRSCIRPPRVRGGKN
jgi:hypothetical protein